VGTCPFRVQYIWPYPKFKIPLPKLFSPGPKVSKKVCHTPVGQKLREEIDFLKAGCFWPRAVPLRLADLTPLPKNYLYRVVQVLKILKDPFIPSKVIHIFMKDRQADRQTNPPHPYTGRQIFFMPVFDTFSREY
jgi:hypothetical protein